MSGAFGIGTALRESPTPVRHMHERRPFESPAPTKNQFREYFARKDAVGMRREANVLVLGMEISYQMKR